MSRGGHQWKEELEARKEKEVRFLIDGGATYTLLPRVAGNLKTKREHTFVLADGSKVKRKFSECYIILPQAHTPVILGEEARNVARSERAKEGGDFPT